ncbi:hypothetical protein V6O07_06795, partial [Arthrospira platensis SPKY2]
WHVLSGVLLGVFWLSRLEWRSLSTEREIARLWAQRKEDLANAASARQETNDVLKEIRQDIKLLLSLNGRTKP